MKWRIRKKEREKKNDRISEATNHELFSTVCWLVFIYNFFLNIYAETIKFVRVEKKSWVGFFVH